PGGPRFSLSHSDAVAVFAFSAVREVGIDVEHVRPVPEADSILGRWFAEAERRAWITSDRGDGAFVRLWTRREAYLKALGVGFSEDGAPREMDPSRWEVHDLEPAPGYLGALVVERSGAEESRRARP
ncbi:MAG TPA: 4'-phosphopantetheinyl transferase superfamily protein, partial [Thermoanaerobaculia bacterium]|nr:4'-phosphopantetheinyl transferase superfamily protein [Thermoanaerobaculia bacterium]